MLVNEFIEGVLIEHANDYLGAEPPQQVFRTHIISIKNTTRMMRTTARPILGG
jgi:hypothetical protein